VVPWTATTATAAGAVEGTAFFMALEGGGRTCAGASVVLEPVNDYTTSRVRALYGTTDAGYLPADQFAVRRLDKADPHLTGAVRWTTCDNQGRFVFPDVPAGLYYIVTAFQWTRDGRIFGGALMRSADVSDGRTVTVTMTAN
jgi:hypothetical protein